MTNTLFEPSLDAIDVRHLQYFAVVAEENNLRRAAERLFMAQPPLSRQIKQLEERLGVALFVRHSKGLTLTDEGAKTLEIIRPLLKMRKDTFARLRRDIHPQNNVLRIGFTTAFEQGIFAGLEARLYEQFEGRLHVSRSVSPKLAADVRKGVLNAALVALPLEASGVMAREIPYAEPLIAAIPAIWPEANAQNGAVPLKLFNQKHLFWFKRERNPAFFDVTKSCFAQSGFTPLCIEEPAEHDVLLARIASGQGFGLFASSFASITRDGVVFAKLTKKDSLYLQLGIVTLPDNNDLAEQIINTFICSL